MKTWALILAVVFIFIQGAACGVVAEQKKADKSELAGKEKKLEEVKKRIKEEKKSVKKIAAKETSILGELERINKGLVGKKEELRKVESSLGEVRTRVAASGMSISRLERDRMMLMERLKLRMRGMYLMRNGDALNVLFAAGAGGPDDLGRRSRYLTSVMDSDKALIDACERNLRILEAERARYLGLKTDMESARKTVIAKKTEAESLQKEKTTLLQGVKQEKAARLKAITELEQAAIELSDLLRKLRSQGESTVHNAKGFGSMKGKLPMPVAGPIVSGYGRVKNPRFATFTFNNGIIIEAGSGKAVRSVYDGKVVYAGWLKGYGQLMIVDNGDGYYTLYAHLQKFLKERGQAVSKGDEIALVGDSGAESRPGLYFEIREHGAPRDPLKWFASK